MQEELIEHFFLLSHNGVYEDIKVQIIGHCDPNDQEAREDFWKYPKGWNQKRALKYWINWFNVLMNIFDLTLLGHTRKKTLIHGII